MTFQNQQVKNIEPYIVDPPEIMTIQDALITIAMYVCITSEVYNGYHHSIDKTLDLAEKSFCFAEDSEGILQRIYSCINLFRVKQPDALFQEALRSLPAELKQITFNWAVELFLNNGKF